MAKRDEVEGLGETLAACRAAAGMTLSQVEDVSGVPMTNLSAYERGLKTPTLAKLYALSRAYGVPVAELLPADALAALPPDDPGERPLGKRK